MRQSVANGQQQTVRRGQGGSQPTRRHQTRDHIGHATEFGRHQHHDVRAKLEFGELKDMVAVDVADRDQGRVHFGPLGNPDRQRIEILPHQMTHDFELDEHRQGRCRQIQQRYEKQGPGNRGPGLGHSARGKETGQQMRQSDGTHHQAKHQRQKVAPGQFKDLLFVRTPARVTRKRLDMHRHAAQRLGALQIFLHGATPALARCACILG